MAHPPGPRPLASRQPEHLLPAGDGTAAAGGNPGRDREAPCAGPPAPRRTPLHSAGPQALQAVRLPLPLEDVQATAIPAVRADILADPAVYAPKETTGAPGIGAEVARLHRPHRQRRAVSLALPRLHGGAGPAARRRLRPGGRRPPDCR